MTTPTTRPDAIAAGWSPDASNARDQWRGPAELADSSDRHDAARDEFPGGASEWDDEPGRRRFLKLMGASLALAGVTGCTRQPKETIAPYGLQPEEIVPGRPLRYATAITLGGVATGALVETHEGRPIKIEGNPDHPMSLGATDVFMQAAILGLYDPDRSRTITYLGEIRPWGDLLEILRGVMKVQEGVQGAGLRILTETITSPSLAAQIRKLLARLPKASWHQYEPVSRDGARAGSVLAFGEPLGVLYRFDRAEVALALDADLFSPGPGSLRHVRDFTTRRREAAGGGAAMARLYVGEPTPSLMGAMADHRLPLPAGTIEHLAREVAASLGLPVPRWGTPPGWGLQAERFTAAVVADLKLRGQDSLVAAGDHQPPVVHALAHAINHRLGAAGRTVAYCDPVEADPVDQAASLAGLAEQMEAGRVEILVLLGGNPAFTAPADLRFAERMQKVALRIHLSQHQDETSALCHWHVPQAHELEAWGDARAHDGTVTIQQPMIEPLYGGRTALDLVAALSGRAASSHDLVREHWSGQQPPERLPADFAAWWRRALHDGMVSGTASRLRQATLRDDWMRQAAVATPTGGLEIVYRPDAGVHDGRFANNGWLQELPRPATRLTWDNAALISPATAGRLGLASEDVVELTHRGRSVLAPVWVVPGQSDDSVTVHLGYGRTRAGRVGDGAGFNAYALRSSEAPWSAWGLQLRATGTRKRLACTQEHHGMEGRGPVRWSTMEEAARDPGFAHHGMHEPDAGTTLYPAHRYEGHAWGMAIDLNACVGCNACVIGCQAENNIPVVGREEVARGREMHWIRVDRYFEGSPERPRIWHQPVPCMHCENAPCEPVCPVGATVHSSEGLNDMVYNRCVGTRYCSNNCPYKVRRFNFLLYSDFETPSLKLMRNPDVSVRSRGVMEKCTYCVQRINAARIDASAQGRPIRDGEIVTACQQACPAQAIVFGDINDPNSRVSRLKADPRNYGLLAELNTRPRTTYLAALRNPSPDLEEA